MTYGASGRTGDINDVPPISGDFPFFNWKSEIDQSEVDQLSTLERKKILNPLYIYATAFTAAMKNYALLGGIYNGYSFDNGPPREGLEHPMLWLNRWPLRLQADSRSGRAKVIGYLTVNIRLIFVINYLCR